MTKLTIVIIFLFLIALAVSFVLAKKFSSPKYQKSNIRQWLTKTDNEYSGIYYDTIPNIKDFVIKTKYTEDVLGKKVITGKHEYSDYVTSLSLQDYINSGSSNGFLNNKKLYYLNGTNKDIIFPTTPKILSMLKIKYPEKRHASITKKAVNPI